MQRVRVVTLNIWNRQSPWEERLKLIRDGLAELSPDVVGLQEVLSFEGRTQAHEIAEGLGYHVAYGHAHELGGGVLFGNAVLSRWPISATHTFPLPAADTDEERCVVLAEVASPFGKLPMFSTHLSWKFHHGYLREQQAVALAAIVMREAPMSGLPPIVVGDFNAEPDATEIRYLRGLQSLEGRSVFFGDCFGQVGQGPGHTFVAERNPYAAGLHEFPRRIDYIFVRGPDKQVRGKPLSAKVVFDEVVDGVAASDHFGVLAEISM